MIDCARLPRDRRRGRRAADGRHGALRRPRRRGLHPNPVESRRRRHHDHAQDARAARAPGFILCRAELGQEDRLAPCSPGLQGGPLCHVIAAKAVCFAIARDAAPSASTRRRCRATPQALGRELASGGCATRDRRHRHPSRAARPARRRAGPARTPRTACTRSASRPTATPCRSTSAPPTVTSPACASARRRPPCAASTRPTSREVGAHHRATCCEPDADLRRAGRRASTRSSTAARCTRASRGYPSDADAGRHDRGCVVSRAPARPPQADAAARRGDTTRATSASSRPRSRGMLTYEATRDLRARAASRSRRRSSATTGLAGVAARRSASCRSCAPASACSTACSR